MQQIKSMPENKIVSGSKSEIEARKIIESFIYELARYIEQKKAIQLILEVNVSPQGGISRSWLRTQTEIK